MNPGDSMLHYRIGDLIGVGGMGEVHQATDTRLGREVAVKLLPEHFSSDPERRQRFEREARSLAALQHPNIATIYGLEEADGRLFLIMELVRGEDLKERLERGPLPTDPALDIARQIAEGLEEAHARGIVHRDLKPANVKITPEGRVKILDFGLARAMQDDTATEQDANNSPTLTAGMTRNGSILGTAAYMSPEQARGYDVDARADIWALGCILFEMLTGRGTFAGDTVSDTLASVLRNDPDWTALPSALPSTVPRLLRRCLAKDSHERFHAVADVRIELNDIDHAPDSGGATEDAGRKRIRGLRVWTAALGWAAAVAALVLWLRDAPETFEPPRLDVLTYSTRDWAPDVSPDGDLIAFVSDRDGQVRIWLKQLAGGGEAPLTDGPDDNPRFSPDGSQVLFSRDVADTRHLYRAAVLGSQLRKVVENAQEGDWSPEGERVAFLRTLPDRADNAVEIGIVEVQSGRERIIASIANRLCYGIRWSPDGAWIAVNESSLTGNAAETSAISLIDTATGATEYVAPTKWTGPYTAVDWQPQGRAILFGQASDVIAHASGVPSLVMTYDLDRETITPLLWTPLMLPKGGWSSSCVVALNDHELVLDEQNIFAELIAYDLYGNAPGAPVGLTQGQGLDRQPVFSPDGERLLFSSNRSGNVDLWIRNQSDGRLSQITDDPAGDWDPAFAPDGQAVLWSSNRDGHMEVWMAALDGSQARRVTNDGVDAENPTMTPDGEWIVYASSNDTKRGVWKIRPDGSDASLLAPGAYLIPDVSHDGRYAVFMSIRNLDYVIHALDLESGELLPYEIELVANERSQNFVMGRARWTEDDTGLIYVGQDENGESGVYLQAFDSEADGPTEPPRRLGGFDPRYTTESLGVSPDGRWLVISALHEQRVLKRVSGLSLAQWQ